MDLKFSVNALKDDKTNVQLNAKVIMNSIVNGKPYGVKIRLVPRSLTTNFHDAVDGTLYQVLIKVNGFTIFNQYYKGAELKDLQTSFDAHNEVYKVEKFLGINLQGTTATFEYSLIIPRSPTLGQDYTLETYVDLFEFQ